MAIFKTNARHTSSGRRTQRSQSEESADDGPHFWIIYHSGPESQNFPAFLSKAKSYSFTQPVQVGCRSVSHKIANLTRQAEAPTAYTASYPDHAKVYHSEERFSSTVQETFKQVPKPGTKENIAGESSPSDPSAKVAHQPTCQNESWLRNTWKPNHLLLCLPKTPQSICEPRNSKNRNYTSQCNR